VAGFDREIRKIGNNQLRDFRRNGEDQYVEYAQAASNERCHFGLPMAEAYYIWMIVWWELAGIWRTQ
jgi:hypothetical protein